MARDSQRESVAYPPGALAAGPGHRPNARAPVPVTAAPCALHPPPYARTMHFRSGWIAPIAILAIALTAVTLSLGDGGHEGARAATCRSATSPRSSPRTMAAPRASSRPRPQRPQPHEYPDSTPSATPTVAANACGAGHASLIAFADAAAAQIDRTPQAIAPADMLTLTRPTLPAGAVRTGPVETTIYSVDVALVSMSQLPNKTIRAHRARPRALGGELPRRTPGYELHVRGQPRGPRRDALRPHHAAAGLRRPANERHQALAGRPRSPAPGSGARPASPAPPSTASNSRHC